MKTAPRSVLIFAFAIATAIPTTEQAFGAENGLSSEPYKVLVAYEEAHARCGPSEDYYRTDPLRHGQALDVYVQTDDGWLGVRPPENSFCWVPASTIKTTDRGQKGSVIEDRTVAWIGTHLGRAKRYRWQVQLAKGEPVTIIGRSEREGPDGVDLWYRIVPPSGEFRWVHRNQVVNTAEELIALARENADRSPRRSVRSDAPSDASEAIAANDVDNDVELGRSILNVRQASAEHSAENQPNVATVRGAGESSRRTSRMNGDVAARVSREFRASVETPTRPLQPIATDSQPQLAEAPRVSRAPTAAPNSVNEQYSNGSGQYSNGSRQQAIGSGLNDQWRTNPMRAEQVGAVQATVQPGLSHHQPSPQPAYNAQTAFNQTPQQPVYTPAPNASMDFATRPRLIEIGSSAAPSLQERANDSNWTIGSTRSSMPQMNPTMGNPSGYASTGFQQSGVRTANHLSNDGSMGQVVLTSGTRQASAESIAQIAREAANADVEQLHLMLSRLMAASSTASETQPIADAADRLAGASQDQLTVARARLLSERVSQYQRVALRRDGGDNSLRPVSQEIRPISQAGGTVLQTSTLLPQPVIDPASNESAGYRENTMNSRDATNARASAPMLGKPMPAPTMPVATGYLVQVYSARTNSPPYALTDNVGNTIAYVTPTPGVNLRHHLNNHINVFGSQGFVHGLSTPHVWFHK